MRAMSKPSRQLSEEEILNVMRQEEDRQLEFGAKPLLIDYAKAIVRQFSQSKLAQKIDSPIEMCNKCQKIKGVFIDTKDWKLTKDSFCDCVGKPELSEEAIIEIVKSKEIKSGITLAALARENYIMVYPSVVAYAIFKAYELAHSEKELQ